MTVPQATWIIYSSFLLFSLITTKAIIPVWHVFYKYHWHIAIQYAKYAKWYWPTLFHPYLANSYTNKQMYIRTNTIYTQKHTRTHTYIHAHIYKHAHPQTHTCTHKHKCKNVCHTHTHARTTARAHTNTHTHTHTHTYSQTDRYTDRQTNTHTHTYTRHTYNKFTGLEWTFDTSMVNVTFKIF